MNKLKLADKLSQLRKKHNLSVTSAAASYGISFKMLYLLEGGKCSPRINTLKKICRYYDVSVSELLKGVAL